MRLNDKCYDVLKWLVMICIPALATAYTGLSMVWALPLAEEISTTANVAAALLGTLLGISTAEYNKYRHM